MKKILWNLSSSKKSNLETLNIINNTVNDYEHYVIGDCPMNIDSIVKHIEEYDIPSINPDVIINNNISDIINHNDTKMISKVEFQDISHTNIELVRENIEKSSLILTSSDYNITNINKLFDLDKRMEIVKSPINFEFINKHKTKLDNVPRIVYNYSTNKNEYYNNAFKKFIDVIRHLNERIAFDVDVVFLNDDDVDYDLKELFSNLHKINVIHSSSEYYEDYVGELWKSEINVSVFDESYECDWSSEIVDSIFTDNAILVPNYGSYKEIVGEGFKWTHNGSVSDISKKLLGLISNIYSIEQNCNESKSYYIQNYPNEINIEKFHSIIKEVQ